MLIILVFPIDIIIEDGKTHDSKIAAEHLLNMKEKFENIMDNENLMFGDAAYDSNVLRTIAKDIKFGKIITPHNLRNSKKKEKNKVYLL